MYDIFLFEEKILFDLINFFGTTSNLQRLVVQWPYEIHRYFPFPILD